MVVVESAALYECLDGAEDNDRESEFGDFGSRDCEGPHVSPFAVDVYSLWNIVAIRLALMQVAEKTGNEIAKASTQILENVIRWSPNDISISGTRATRITGEDRCVHRKLVADVVLSNGTILAGDWGLTSAWYGWRNSGKAPVTSLPEPSLTTGMASTGTVSNAIEEAAVTRLREHIASHDDERIFPLVELSEETAMDPNTVEKAMDALESRTAESPETPTVTRISGDTGELRWIIR